MTFSLKHVAVATMAVASIASAQAASISGVIDSFTLGSDISQLLSTVLLEAQGTASFSAATATLTLPATSTTTSNTSGSDLVTFAQGAGLKITSGANVITLADLSFNNATKAIDAIISLNGAVKFSGTALTSATASTLNTPFLTTGVAGQLTSGSMKLTSGAATALATALGYSFLATAIQAYDFGTFKVTAPVPEPSTYALMGLGLVGVALAARKRKAA